MPAIGQSLCFKQTAVHLTNAGISEDTGKAETVKGSGFNMLSQDFFTHLTVENHENF